MLGARKFQTILLSAAARILKSSERLLSATADWNSSLPAEVQAGCAPLMTPGCSGSRAVATPAAIFLWLTPLFGHAGLLGWKCALFLDPCLQGENMSLPEGEPSFSGTQGHEINLWSETCPGCSPPLSPNTSSSWFLRGELDTVLKWIFSFLVHSQALKRRTAHFIMESFSVYESTEQSGSVLCLYCLAPPIINPVDRF